MNDSAVLIRFANRLNRSIFPNFWSRAEKIGFSVLDQVLSVAGMFLINVLLARTVSKSAYGVFALSYSFFVFADSLHTASILEPYTVFGSGRYSEQFGGYYRLMFRLNAIVCTILATLLMVVWAVAKLFGWGTSTTLLGLTAAIGVILTSYFVRRTFYSEHRSNLAAGVSIVAFAVLVLCLWFTVWRGLLNGFSAFIIVAISWGIACLLSAKHLPHRSREEFLVSHPHYWYQHWDYARWVLGTAFILQASYQGFYWLVAGFLSTKDVADLRAIYMIVTPVDQLLIAIGYLVVPRLASYHASRRINEFFSFWKTLCLLSLVVTVAMALAIRMFGATVLHLLYGGKFDSAIRMLYILSVVPVIMAVGNTMHEALKSAEHPRFVFAAYLASGIVTFAAGIPLVIHFGLMGAAYGMVSSAIAYTITLSLGMRWLARQAPAFAK